MNSNGDDASFNLCEDPWIPCALRTGPDRLLSLSGLFERCEEITELPVVPPQRAALMRLLLCVAMRALNGPKNEDEWKSCRGRIVSAAREYLKKWKDSFDLYGPRAFLQVSDLEGKENATLDKLDFSLASGNNHTLFDHSANPEGRIFPPSWQALSLISFQMFSCGGRIGVARWRGAETNGKGSSEHAPGLESTPVHVFISAQTLLDTIHLNLIPWDRLGKQAVGCPVWEAPPRNPGDSATASTLLGRMAVMSRAIKLLPGSSAFVLANGIKYPKLPEFVDPFLVKVSRKEEGALGYLPISTSKHPWRELQSILLLADSGPGGPKQLANLRLMDPEAIVRLWSGGLAADRGKLEDFAEWSLSFRAGLAQGDAAMKAYQDGVACADSAASLLRGAFKEANGENKKRLVPAFAKEQALVSFWHELDLIHEELAEAAFKGSLDEWRKQVKLEALASFDLFCPAGTPRQMLATAKARGELSFLLEKIVVKNEMRNNKGAKKAK